MIRTLNPIVESILDQRYHNRLLVESLADDGIEPGNKPKAPTGIIPDVNTIRNYIGDKLMDVSDWSGYTEVANKLEPVKGMAQAEVPLSKENKDAYDSQRTILAKELVQQRKEAHANKEDVDETEILKRTVSKNPNLAHILTRDEYESLAGDITNPLSFETTKIDSEGKESKESVNLPKWSGISDSHAHLYDFLKSANDSMTTPEGLATSAAIGGAFKLAGAGLGAAGKAVAPAVTKYVPGLVSGATKVKELLPGLVQRALPKTIEQAANQSVNLAGLGLLTGGAIKAYGEGNLSKYAGSVAGGIPGFALGSKATGEALTAAKPIGSAAVNVGKAAAKSAKAAGEYAKDIATDVIATQKSEQGFPAQIKSVLSKIANMITPSGENLLTPEGARDAKLGIRRFRAASDTPSKTSYVNPETGNTHEVTPLGYELITDPEGNIVGERETLTPRTEKVPSTTPSKPSTGKTRALATALAASIAASGPVATTSADIAANVARPREAIVSVESKPGEPSSRKVRDLKPIEARQEVPAPEAKLEEPSSEKETVKKKVTAKTEKDKYETRKKLSKDVSKEVTKQAEKDLSKEAENQSSKAKGNKDEGGPGTRERIKNEPNEPRPVEGGLPLIGGDIAKKLQDLQMTSSTGQAITASLGLGAQQLGRYSTLFHQR